MSYCKKTGPDNKDIVIFATKENHSVPSKIELPPAEPAPGLILENGDINWNCPCLGGMATGPCGVEFRTAFSCFHYSDHEPKGAECLESFQAMQDCMKRYPSLYSNIDKDNDQNDDFGTKPIMPVETPHQNTEKDTVTTISKTTDLKIKKNLKVFSGKIVNNF